MSINIVSADPYDGQQNVTIDSKITIDFDSPIDPFTVENGVSLYTYSSGLWTGPDLISLDTEYRDVLDISDEYTYFKYSFTIEDTDTVVGGRLVITPLMSLIPDRDYYLSIYPGSDAERYLSKLTVVKPVVTPLDEETPPTGEINILSAYIGSSSDTYIGTFVAPTELSIYKESLGVETAQSFTLTEELTSIELSDISLSVTQGWSAGDSFEIDVFPGEGIASVLNNKFTTTHIDTSTVPSSNKIVTLSQVTEFNSIKLIDSIPSDLSLNNPRCNPITLRFNQTVKAGQDLDSIISVYKVDMDSWIKRRVSCYYKVNGSTIKIYLSSLK